MLPLSEDLLKLEEKSVFHSATNTPKIIPLSFEESPSPLALGIRERHPFSPLNLSSSAFFSESDSLKENSTLISKIRKDMKRWKNKSFRKFSNNFCDNKREDENSVNSFSLNIKESSLFIDDNSLIKTDDEDSDEEKEYEILKILKRNG